MNLNYIFKSFSFFLKSLVVKKSYDVIFYYPVHFNRGKDGENEFFEPFYEICKKNDINYLILEEPEFHKKTKRNKDAVPFDFIFICILILRKVIPLSKFESFQHRECFIAKLLKPVFFRNFSFSNYIVLSNSMMGFFRGLNKDAKLFDYQHGVITSKHIGYISSTNETPEHIKLNDANIMVYGKGFAGVLTRTVIDKYYDAHVYIAGQSIKGEKKEQYAKRIILFSLQFADPDPKLNQNILVIIVKFFEKYKDFFISNNITILLKHHPRFQHDIDPSPLYAFEFTKLYEGELLEVLSESCLHLTFHSTTTFEAASMGIPTLLLQNTFLNPQFFIDDYKYPLGTKSESEIISSIERYIGDKVSYEEDAQKVYDWYHYFYTTIDEKLFVDLIKGKKLEKN